MGAGKTSRDYLDTTNAEKMMDRRNDTTNYANSYVPWKFFNKAAMHPALRVIVLGNPQDHNVF